jgi:hypothetical protein
MVVPGLSQVVSYEADSFPGAEWDRIVDCTPERWIEQGWLHQEVESRQCDPVSDTEAYIRAIGEFEGALSFFIEWRIEADGDREEIPFGGPAGLGSGSLGPVDYTFFISRDQAKLFRDSRLPIVFVEIERGVPHIHRLEHYGAERYVWYIDGEVVDSGRPEGQYPSNTPSIAWLARSRNSNSHVRWDYVRYGVIPEDGSGDYDSDDDVDEDDYYFFAECFAESGPGVDAGPGCRFADFDDDTDVDLADFAAFQERFAESR